MIATKQYTYIDNMPQVGPHPAAALEAINWLGEQGAFDRANRLAQETAGRLTAQGLDWWEMQSRGEYWLSVGRKIDEVHSLLLSLDFCRLVFMRLIVFETQCADDDS